MSVLPAGATTEGIFLLMSTSNPATAYSGLTANMPSDPEVLPLGEASESVSAADFPITSALCIDTSLEWVPSHEEAIVPDTMARLCRQCPGRSGCLMWAVATRSDGYWAATTTADRDELRKTQAVSLDAADLEQAKHRAARAADHARAVHPRGEGGWFFYRHRGCRCPECRAANSARRRAERDRKNMNGA